MSTFTCQKGGFERLKEYSNISTAGKKHMFFFVWESENLNYVPDLHNGIEEASTTPLGGGWFLYQKGMRPKGKHVNSFNLVIFFPQNFQSFFLESE